MPSPQSPTQEDLVDLLSGPDDQKVNVLKEWNQQYRTGSPIVEDKVYDTLFESLPANHPYRSEVGFSVSDSRKISLPIPMYSMDKVKSHDEILKWMKSKNIADHEEVIITPKYDGLSFLYQPSTGNAYTRGNGKEGQFSR
ncbi:MAG: hypothetical protein HQL32_13260, partial [Planctomycetes bacterium]|nr:hypothetical protein [Planctomycetota bacterium]